MGVIVMGKIESGCCRVDDRCVKTINYEEIETDSCVCGKNVRLELKNVEEEVSVLIDNMVFVYASIRICRKSLLALFSVMLK
jgi:hypothetical protein